MFWLRCHSCLCWRLGSIHLPNNGQAGETWLRLGQPGQVCLTALCQSRQSKVQLCKRSCPRRTGAWLLRFWTLTWHGKRGQRQMWQLRQLRKAEGQR